MGARAGPRAGPGPCAGLVGAEAPDAGAPPGATLLAAGDPGDNSGEDPGPEGGKVPGVAPGDGDGTAPGGGGGKPPGEAVFKPGPGAGAKAKPEAGLPALPDPEAGPKAVCGPAAHADGADADEGERRGENEEAGNGTGGNSKPEGGRGPNSVGLLSGAGAGAVAKASGTPGIAKHSLSNNLPWPCSSLNSFVYAAATHEMQQAFMRKSSQGKLAH